MTNLFRCITCGKTITAEEAEKHHCKPTITKYKTIEATSYFTVKNDNNEECIVIDALNGRGYTFVIKEPNLIPLTEGLSCDPEHPTIFYKNKTDGDFPIPAFA